MVVATATSDPDLRGAEGRHPSPVMTHIAKRLQHLVRFISSRAATGKVRFLTYVGMASVLIERENQLHAAIKLSIKLGTLDVFMHLCGF